MTCRILAIDGGLSVPAYKASGKLTPFVRRILEARLEYEPEITCVAWDGPREKTWRRGQSALYKARRPERESGYVSSLADVQAGLTSLGIVQLRAGGEEADDILATVAVTWQGPTLIYSADKDLLQLVRGDTAMLRAGNDAKHPDAMITEATLRAYETSGVGGLNADEWRDLLILAGDPVDGIPGLSKIGLKTARAIIGECPCFIDLVLQGDAEIARRACAGNATLAKHVEKAISERADLELSRRLVELRMVDDLEIVDGDYNAEKATAWLRAIGLGRYA